MKARDDLTVELLDLRDYDLPFFNEMASNLWMPSKDPKAVAWQNKLAKFDGFVFVVSEYNRSVTASLTRSVPAPRRASSTDPHAGHSFGARSV